MNIKKIANTVIQFIINRVIEILGVCFSIIGLLLLIALISYSPDDPNFIFPENTGINNLLGFQGSYISDLFFQSIGITSYLISLTLILTGINIFRSKDLFLLIDNIFCTILYSFFGTHWKPVLGGQWSLKAANMVQKSSPRGIPRSLGDAFGCDLAKSLF